VNASVASERAAADKERVYGAEAKRLGYSLVTFALDTTGALGKEAKAFVEKIGRVYESGEEVPDPMFRGRFLMELSAVLQRGNAECVSAGLARARESEMRRHGLRFGHRRP
jgi:endonuclease YncB( thermonuclease family)